jgi:hypothetical protein
MLLVLNSVRAEWPREPLSGRKELIYRVIKKSLCTLRLQYNHQVHRDSLIILYISVHWQTLRKDMYSNTYLKYVTPWHAMRGTVWERNVALLILNLCAIWGCGVNATSRPLYPQEWASITHCRECWLGPRAGAHMHEEEKTCCFPPEFEP